jgi:hypothetical protein
LKYDRHEPALFCAGVILAVRVGALLVKTVDAA